MNTDRIKTRIHNINRVVIAGLSILGFLCDGYQFADSFFCLSLLLWLWQAECGRLEQRLFDALNRNVVADKPTLRHP